MEVGLGIALLFVVNAWGVLLLIGLEKIQKQLTKYHGTDLERQCNEAEDHSAENFPASDDRFV